MYFINKFYKNNIINKLKLNKYRFKNKNVNK